MRSIATRLSLRHMVVSANFMIMLVGLSIALIVYYSTSYSLLKSFSYNSDALYLSSVYADILNGDNLSRWNLQPAPAFFPDMVLYFLIRAITPNMHVAAVVFGMMQYLVFTLGLLLLARQTIPQSYGLARYSLIVLMGIVFLLLIDKLDYMSQMIFVTNFHFGVVLSIPFVLTILCKLISRSRLRAPLVCALCILSFLMSASDGLYLIQVTIPLIGSLGILYLMKKIDMKHALVVSGALLTASFAGLMLTSAIISKSEMVGAYLFRPELMISSLSLLFKTLLATLFITPVHAILECDFLLICAFILIKLVRQSFRDRHAVIRSTEILLASYFLLSFTVNILVITSLGVFSDRSGLRYFLPLLIFSGFWGIPFILRIPPSIKTSWLEWNVLAVLSLTVLLSLRGIGHQQVSDIFTDIYYPAYINCIDENTARMGIKYGIAQYWQAKPISMLTQNKLRVVQVNRDLSPFYWINNRAWYAMEPEFAVIDLSRPQGDRFRLDDNLITSRYGAPDAVFQCGDSKVMVYRRPDSEFKTIFQSIP